MLGEAAGGYDFITLICVSTCVSVFWRCSQKKANTWLLELIIIQTNNKKRCEHILKNLDMTEKKRHTTWIKKIPWGWTVTKSLHRIATDKQLYRWVGWKDVKSEMLARDFNSPFSGRNGRILTHINGRQTSPGWANLKQTQYEVSAECLTQWQTINWLCTSLARTPCRKASFRGPFQPMSKSKIMGVEPKSEAPLAVVPSLLQ